MTDQIETYPFIERLLQRPLPASPIGRIKTLARELAEGAAAGVWEQAFTYFLYGTEDQEYIEYVAGRTYDNPLFLPESDVLRQYLKKRWNAPLDFRELRLLEVNGYLVERIFSQGEKEYSVTKAAFDLIEEVEPATIFISYRRRDSSAFALLVLKTLKEAGLNAFLDMTIQPGDNWHAYIRDQIRAHEYFILLLGKETLSSEVVRDEIRWAHEAGATILPVWHSDFEYRPAEWDLPPEIDRILQTTHTIRVLDESALGYNNALVELLNRFGITP